MLIDKEKPRVYKALKRLSEMEIFFIEKKVN
mgnify:CR=1 FL=1